MLELYAILKKKNVLKTALSAQLAKQYGFSILQATQGSGVVGYIINLSTNLYASLWFPVCQSRRFNGKADQKL